MPERYVWFPVEELWRRFENKYEATVVAAGEARRLARLARERGERLTEKVTVIALRRLLRGEVYYYIAPPAPTKVYRLVESGEE